MNNSGIPNKRKEVEKLNSFLSYPNFISEKHHFFYGSPWCIGFEQFNYVKQNGLKEKHKLMDFGCGCLRAGIHFIRYLDAGNYFGIDIDEESLSIGMRYEIPLNRLEVKLPNVSSVDRFIWVEHNGTFDYVISFSVLKHMTHKNPESMLEHASALCKLLKSGGFLYIGLGKAIQKHYLEELDIEHIKTEMYQPILYNAPLEWHVYKKIT